jgi:predicted transcriptional regulator
VGYRAWIQSGEDDEISAAHARQGVADARRDMESYVLASTYRELSDGDIRFLEAMLPDPRESRVSDIAARMGVSSGYASRYRSRLLAAGVISELARGILAMDIPGMRAYVRTRRDEREEASS